MLKPLASQRGTARCCPQQEALAAAIRSRPNKICHALKTKHGVENEERDRVDAMIRIRGARRNKGTQRSSLRDALFENLPISRLFIIEEVVRIYRFVELPGMGIDTTLPE